MTLARCNALTPSKTSEHNLRASVLSSKRFLNGVVSQAERLDSKRGSTTATGDSPSNTIANATSAQARNLRQPVVRRILHDPFFSINGVPPGLDNDVLIDKGSNGKTAHAVQVHSPKRTATKSALRRPEVVSLIYMNN